MRVDTVILDIDGTLVDSNFQHTIAWQRAFRSAGITLEGWQLHRAIGMGGDRLIAHVAGDGVEQAHGDQIRDAWKIEADSLLTEVKPLAGATPLLDVLRDRGLKVVLATSGKPDHTDYALEILDARHRIDHLTTSEDVDASKPAPDLLTTALNAVDGSRAVMIGDSVWDAIAAQDAGMPMVGLLTGGFSRDELERADAARVYDGPSALLEDLPGMLDSVAGAAVSP